LGTEKFIDEIKFDTKGLVTAIAQDYKTKGILMVAYMNKETLKESLESGKMVYWSRSRQKRWLKGESSGNIQYIMQIGIDCDGDAILFSVEQVGGAACHKGYESCFYRGWKDGEFKIDQERVFDPEERYGK